jgi:hypothetical protein
LKKGLNPLSFADLVFVSPYLTTAIKTGIITGVIALAVSSLLLCYFAVLFLGLIRKIEVELRPAPLAL